MLSVPSGRHTDTAHSWEEQRPIKVKDLKQVLEHLGENAGAIPVSQLYALSDLSKERMVEFSAVWETFPTARRRRVIHALVELAEASFQVNFDAIFRHCLQDYDEQVRATAIDGLWENEEVSLVGPLLTMLRSDPSAQVRAAAATGLSRYVLAGELEQIEIPIQVRIVAELLTTIHLAGESVEVRRRSLESVSYACTPEVLETLETAYYDEDEQTRISAVVGMGRSCDKRWSEIILAELESDSAAMRYEAALACGELMLRPAVPVLAKLINDADYQVRDVAIWSLGQIGGPSARKVLLEAYQEADEDMRAILEEALAEEALSAGDLEFVLYEVDNDEEDDGSWFLENEDLGKLEDIDEEDWEL